MLTRRLHLPYSVGLFRGNCLGLSAVHSEVNLTKELLFTVLFHR